MHNCTFAIQHGCLTVQTTRKSVKQDRPCESSDSTAICVLANVAINHCDSPGKNTTNKTQNTHNLNPDSAFVNYSANTRPESEERSKVLFVIILVTQNSSRLILGETGHPTGNISAPKGEINTPHQDFFTSVLSQGRNTASCSQILRHLSHLQLHFLFSLLTADVTGCNS